MKQSAGLLLYRLKNAKTEVLLVHPGGPFWAKKDKAAWSIPKGEFTNEDPLAAAKREFQEEVGIPAPEGDYADLGQFKQPSGKIVFAWALQHDLDLSLFKSNLFEMEWPPKSGQHQSFPEADKAQWLSLAAAKIKIVKGQVPILDALAAITGHSFEAEPEAAPQISLF